MIREEYKTRCGLVIKRIKQKKETANYPIQSEVDRLFFWMIDKVQESIENDEADLEHDFITGEIKNIERNDVWVLKYRNEIYVPNIDMRDFYQAMSIVSGIFDIIENYSSSYEPPIIEGKMVVKNAKIHVSVLI